MTAQENAFWDNYTMHAIGIPSPVLMEKAAMAVVHEIERRQFCTEDVVIVCGSGNNGGDGVAAARIFRDHGVSAEVIEVGDFRRYSEELMRQIAIADRLQIRHGSVDGYASEDGLSPLKMRLRQATLIVDALFGIGLHRCIEGKFAEVIAVINEAHAEGTAVAAIDIPSGISADNGQILGCAVHADLTVTISSEKPGLYLYPGRIHTGNLAVCEIGIPKEFSARDNSGNMRDYKQIPDFDRRIYRLEDVDLRALKERDESGNKGTFGKVLVIAGSREMYGAAYLSAKAALKSGVGMVKVFTHEANRAPLAAAFPEALISTYSEFTEGCAAEERLLSDMKWADQILIGPGLSTDDTAGLLLKTVIRKYQGKQPVVMDADALNLLAVMKYPAEQISVPLILTPHVAEMSRLTGQSVAEIKSDLIASARKCALRYHAAVILKDACSVTALPDGSCFLNTTGNSALATAGSGDVLAGMTAAYAWLLRSSGLPAAAAAAYAHGRCGDLAAAKFSAAAVTASNLLEVMHQLP